MPGGGEDRFLMFNGQVLIIFMGRSFRFTIYHISRGGGGGVCAVATRFVSHDV